MIGSTIAPIFFNTMEDSGALPLEMDVKDLAMGDLIDLCVYEQVVKKHGTNDVLVKFDLKHELMLDQAVVVVSSFESMIWNVNLWVHRPNANIVSYISCIMKKKMGGDESEADRMQ